MQNVGTALAVYEAVQKNKPLVDGIVTVTGSCMKEQRNFRLRVGTTFDKIMFAIGGFPKDGEKHLIDAIIKRRVPSMGLPIDVGAVVQNVGTALAVYEAVQKNKPLVAVF